MTEREYFVFVRAIARALLRVGALDPRAPTVFALLRNAAP